MIISKKKLAEALGVSTRTLDRREKLPEGFPPKVRISARKVGYRLTDVEKYLDNAGAAG